ncbi:MAG: hypothetical protein JW942_03620 [Opitutales bacterium]|nr:hypothetical protein [Opitutales bacterium]
MDNLLNEMHTRKSVLNGWSAVLNLHQSALNGFVQHQWDTTNTVSLCRRDKADLAQLDFKLASPQLRLRHGEATVDFDIQLLDAALKRGTLNAGAAASYSCQPDDPQVLWTTQQELHTDEKFSITGSVPIVMTGADTPENMRVELDFANGSYELNCPQDLDAHLKGFAEQLRQWFTTKARRPVIVAFKFKPADKGRHIRPTKWQLNATLTDAGTPILQLFMATKNRQPTNAALNLHEPIPTDDGSTFTLIIDSEVVVDDIVTEFNECPTQLKLVAVYDTVANAVGNEMDTSAGDFASTAKIWYSQTSHPMEYRGTIDFAGILPNIENHADLGMNFVGSPRNGLVIEHYTDEGANIALDLSVNGNFPVHITGEGLEQRMSFSAGPLSVDAIGMAEYAVKAQLEDFLNNDIKNSLTSISFDPVSNLLLNQLSFAGNSPKITAAQLPGDFVVAGVFKKTAFE